MILPSPPPSARYQAYERLQRPLEKQFHAKLMDGELLASGIPKNTDPTAARMLLDPEVFSESEIAWDSLSGTPSLTGQYRISSLEIFEPPGIPRNVRVVPQWYWDAYEPNTAEAALADPDSRGSEASPSGFEHSRATVMSGSTGPSSD